MTAKQYLETIAEFHSVDDAILAMRKLHTEVDRALDQVKRSKSSGKGLASLHSKFSNTVGDKSGVEDNDDLGFLDLSNLIPVVEVDNLLRTAFPYRGLDYELFRDCLREAEIICNERNVEFHIRKHSLTRDYYQPLEAEDLVHMLKPVMAFVALNKRNANLMPTEYINYLNELCAELDPSFEPFLISSPGGAIRLFEWARLAGQCCVLNQRIRHEESLKRLFAKYDADQSGSIDVAEFAAPVFDILCDLIEPTEDQKKILSAIAKKVSKDVITAMDKSGDEEIDFDEFRVCSRAVREKQNEILHAFSKASNLVTLQNELGVDANV